MAEQPSGRSNVTCRLNAGIFVRAGFQSFQPLSIQLLLSAPRPPLYSLRTDPKENTTSLLFKGRCLATGDVFDYY
jgi:hypothetical protein